MASVICAEQGLTELEYLKGEEEVDISWVGINSTVVSNFFLLSSTFQFLIGYFQTH